MAFRASQATQSQGLLLAMQTANWVKQIAQTNVSLLAGTVTSDQVFALADNLRGGINILNAQAAIPGIAAYAQAQFNDATYNIATEFTNMVNAIQAVITWIVTNFPKDAGGFVQAYTLNADGSRTAASFTSTQTAGLTTALNAVIAAIS